jgi:hypothetical protein
MAIPGSFMNNIFVKCVLIFTIWLCAGRSALDSGLSDVDSRKMQRWALPIWFRYFLWD